MKSRVALIALLGLGCLALASAGRGVAPCDPPVTKPPCATCEDVKYTGPHIDWPVKADTCEPGAVPLPCPEAVVEPCEKVKREKPCLPNIHDPCEDYAIVLGPCDEEVDNNKCGCKKSPTCAPVVPPCQPSPTCAPVKPPCGCEPSPTCAPVVPPCQPSPTCAPVVPPCQPSPTCAPVVPPCQPSPTCAAPSPTCDIISPCPNEFFPGYANLDDMKVRAQLCTSPKAFSKKHWAFYKGYKKICCEFCTVTASKARICSADVGHGCFQVPRWACDDATPEIVIQTAVVKKVKVPKKPKRDCDVVCEAPVQPCAEPIKPCGSKQY